MRLGAIVLAVMGSLPALLGGAATLVPAPAMAGLLFSEDFESSSLAAVFSGSGPQAMQQATLGAGACRHFGAGGSAAGQALCGSGTVSDSKDYEEFVFSHDGLGSALRIDLSLAAWQTGLLDGPLDPADLLDFVDIFLGDQRLVRFHGVNTRTADHDGLQLAQIPSQFLGPDLVPDDGIFRDLSFYAPAAGGLASRDLSFRIRLTGNTEFVALDSISVTAIPAPGALGLLSMGLLIAGAALRRRTVREVARHAG